MDVLPAQAGKAIWLKLLRRVAPTLIKRDICKFPLLWFCEKSLHLIKRLNHMFNSGGVIVLTNASYIGQNIKPV